MHRLAPLAVATRVLAALSLAATGSEAAQCLECHADLGDHDAVSLLQVQTGSVTPRQRHQLGTLHLDGEAAYLTMLDRRRAELRNVQSWPLWPERQAPSPLKGVGAEAFVPAASMQDDEVAARCCPGDTKGNFYYNVTEPRLYYYPAKSDSPDFKNATVLIFPGGGYQFLAWDKEGVDIAQWLNTLGYNAFVLKYRVPVAGTEVVALIDAQRALSMIRSNASAFSLNASRVGVMGFSAGGGLVGMVSTAALRMYTGVDGVDAASCMPDFSMYIYGAFDATLTKLSPARHPPAYIASAQNDQCVAATMVSDMYDALLAKGTPVEMHMYPDGRHGYGRCSMYTESGSYVPVCEWTNTARTWLEQTVIGVAPSLPAVLAPGV